MLGCAGWTGRSGFRERNVVQGAVHLVPRNRDGKGNESCARKHTSERTSCDGKFLFYLRVT